MIYFYKFYALLVANRPQVAGDFVKDTYNADIQRVSDNKQKRQQPVDDFSLLFLIPWGHHCCILEVCRHRAKVQSFHPLFLGQLSFYVSAINQQFKTDIDNPTIGLLICKGKDNVVEKYALESNKEPMGISEYQLSKLFPKDFKSSMPTIEELEKGLKDNREK